MTINHITVAAYYRIFIGSIFENYKRILYLDCDLLVLDDVSKLYNIDLNDCCCAAAINLGMTYFNKESKLYSEVLEYMTDTLKIGNMDSYFNSGVMVFDLEKMREKKYEEQMIEVAKINNKYMHDQNVLNSVLQNDYYRLDFRWNYQWHVRYKYPDYKKQMGELAVEYDNARNNPGIIHYLTPTKPWNNEDWEFSDLYWKYVANTPLEQLLIIKKDNKKTISSKKTGDAGNIDYIKRITNQSTIIRELTDANLELERQLELIEQSYSYKIGRAITLIPRRIMAVVKRGEKE